jgi:hypothetical protein
MQNKTTEEILTQTASASEPTSSTDIVDLPAVTEDVIKKASEQIDWDTIKIVIGESQTARFYAKKLKDKNISQLSKLQKRAKHIGMRLQLDGGDNVLLVNVNKELAIRTQKKV